MIGVYEWYALGCALFMLMAAAALILWHDPRGANWMSDILSRRSRALFASRAAYKQAWIKTSEVASD